MSSHERTGWRDLEFSLRHRDWGLDVPTVDVDFLAIEYDLGEPVALVDYKDCHALFPRNGDSNARALGKLGVNHGGQFVSLPAWLAYYFKPSWSFRVFPLNAAAAQWFRPGHALSEFQYVAQIYAVRNRLPPPAVIAACRTDGPPPWAWCSFRPCGVPIDLVLADAGPEGLCPSCARKRRRRA